MSQFLDFWAQHAPGVFVFLFVTVVTVILAVWALRKLMWMFGRGRYNPANQGQRLLAAAATSESSLGRLVTEFFMKIISQFRHFLALLIFLLFAGVLVYVVWFAS